MLAGLYAVPYLFPVGKRTAGAIASSVTNWFEERSRQRVQNAIDSQTKALSAVDMVEVFVLGDVDNSVTAGFPIRPYEKSFAPILSHTRVEGTAAESLASIWRSRDFGGGGSLCHFPIYGLRFYSGGTLLCETSICWSCHNVFLKVGWGDYDWVGFSDADEELLNHLQSIATLPLKVQAAIALSHAKSYSWDEETDQAEAAFDKAIHLDPTSANAYWARGRFYEWQGNIRRALEEYSNAIASDREFAHAYCSRAELYARQGEDSLAIADISKAIEIERKFERLEFRALLYLKGGFFDLAIADLAEIEGKACDEYYLAYLKDRRTRAEDDVLQSPDHARFKIVLNNFIVAMEKLQSHLDSRGPTKIVSPDGRFFLKAMPNHDQVIEVVVESSDGREVWKEVTSASAQGRWLTAWGEGGELWMASYSRLFRWKANPGDSWSLVDETQTDFAAKPKELKPFYD